MCSHRMSVRCQIGCQMPVMMHPPWTALTLLRSRRSVVTRLRPLILDCNITTFNPAEFAQSLQKSGNAFAHGA
jgi:hypothetical protein